MYVYIYTHIYTYPLSRSSVIIECSFYYLGEEARAQQARGEGGVAEAWQQSVDERL